MPLSKVLVVMVSCDTVLFTVMLSGALAFTGGVSESVTCTVNG